MEEVYTCCVCGCQAWMIRSAAIECTKCGKLVALDEIVNDEELMSPKEFNARIRAVESVKKGVELE